MKVRQFIFLFLFAAVFSFAQDRNNAKKDFLKYVLEYSIVTDEIKDVAKEIETVGLEKGILKKVGTSNKGNRISTEYLAEGKWKLIISHIDDREPDYIFLGTADRAPFIRSYLTKEYGSNSSGLNDFWSEVGTLFSYELDKSGLHMEFYFDEEDY
jgi:hypothetical protein